MKIRPAQVLLDPFKYIPTHPPSPEEPRDRYFVTIEDHEVPVLRKFNAMAYALDANDNGIIEADELLDPEADLSPIQVDHGDYTLGLKAHLAGVASPYAPAYPSAAKIAARMQELARDYPTLTELVPLGKSKEGRTIWALHIGRVYSNTRPGVLITGGHHAREWVPVSAVVDAAQALLEGYEADPDLARKVDSLDLWFVPLVNPDGYEYSRTADPAWRKNRDPVAGGEIGVDLNRNYQAEYRIYGDAPDDFSDDIGASDNPAELTYRGPHATSEPETQVLTDFVDTHPNLRAMLDVHSFGRLILYPGTDQPERRRRYLEAAQHIKEALDVPYTPLSIPELYPTTGDFTAYGDSLGMLSMGLELGKAFQPSPDKAEQVRAQGTKAILAFLDEVLKEDQKGRAS